MVRRAWWATIHGVAKSDDDMTDDFYSLTAILFLLFFFLSGPTYVLNLLNLTVYH